MTAPGWPPEGAVLGLFPPDIARSLEVWLRALSTLLGPLRARVRVGQGSPDGYDGITARAPFDRLLLTEWAMAEMLPEEFLRRAAQRELLFSRMAWREEAQVRTSVMLFDPGPMQLGAPRLGQLAVLLTLFERANAAGARFGWAALQQAGESNAALTPGLDRGSLQRFLRGKMAFEATEANLSRWLDLAHNGGWEDVWVVGAPGLAPPGLRARGVKTPIGRVEIAESEDASQLHLRVTRGALDRRVTLTLPSLSIGLRILRDAELAPRVEATPARVVEGPAPTQGVTLQTGPLEAPLVWLNDGRKLAALGRDGSLTLIALAPQGARPAAKLKTVTAPEGARILGIGWHQKRALLLCAREGRLSLCTDLGRRHAMRVQQLESRELTVDQLPGHLARLDVLPRQGGRERVVLRDARDRLWSLDRGEVALLTEGVQAKHFSNTTGRLTILQRAEHGFADAQVTRYVPLSIESFLSAIAGRSVYQLDPHGDAVTLCGATRSNAREITLEPGEYPVGVGVDFGAVLCLDARAQRLSMVSAQARKTLITWPQAVQFADTSNDGCIAVLLEDGSAAVYRLRPWQLEAALQVRP
ncbi:MAG: hypothetical protein JNK72_20000 [Myxococcales bacterium]|nr:hypothetical protein [Myxococcales bacterium]